MQNTNHLNIIENALFALILVPMTIEFEDLLLIKL